MQPFFAKLADKVAKLVLKWHINLIKHLNYLKQLEIVFIIFFLVLTNE